MGYNTYVTGEIRIEPPLSWAEIRDCPYLTETARARGLCLRLRDAEQSIETDEGTLLRRTATGVLPIYDYAFKAHPIEEQLRQIVRAFDGHEFTGYLEGFGDRDDDRWRLTIRDGAVVRIKARIVWPDDAPSDASR